MILRRIFPSITTEKRAFTCLNYHKSPKITHTGPIENMLNTYQLKTKPFLQHKFPANSYVCYKASAGVTESRDNFTVFKISLEPSHLHVRKEACASTNLYSTEMANQWRITIMTYLVLFMMMEEVKPVLAADVWQEIRMLENRVNTDIGNDVRGQMQRLVYSNGPCYDILAMSKSLKENLRCSS